MIPVIQLEIFDLKTCFKVIFLYDDKRFYPIKMDKTYLPEDLSIVMTDRPPVKVLDTDWLFRELTECCVNARDTVPNLTFDNGFTSYRYARAHSENDTYYITLKL